MECLDYDRTDPLNRLTWDWNYVVFAYPGRQLGYDGPLPSMRLKAMRGGLQDMEYLQLLAERDGNRNRADALLLKYYTSWDRQAHQPLKPGSVRVGPEAPYQLRADILAALGKALLKAASAGERCRGERCQGPLSSVCFPRIPPRSVLLTPPMPETYRFLSQKKTGPVPPVTEVIAPISPPPYPVTVRWREETQAWQRSRPK